MIDTEALGTIYIDTTLDTSGWEQDISKGAARIARMPAIAPKVDSTALHDLNKLLDRKQQHLRETQQYFAANPIKPLIDARAMSAQYNISVNASVNPQSIGKSLKDLALAPLRVPVSIVSKVGTGLLEGVGRELSLGIGKSLNNALNTSLGSSIGSIELLSKTFGDRFANSIANSIQRAQSNNPTFRQVAANLKSAAQEGIGKEAIAIEVNARNYKGQAAVERQRQQARKGILPAIREAEASLPAKKADYEAARKQAMQELDLLRMAERSAARRDAVRSKLLDDPTVSSSEKAMLLVNRNQQREESKKRAAQRVEIIDWIKDQKAVYSRAIAQTRDLNRQLGQLVEKPLPQTYQKFLDAKKPGLKRSLVPELVSEQFRPNAQGQTPNAQYDPFSNKLALNPDLYAKVVSGKPLSKKDARIFSEEIDHAVDFDFGTLQGVEANRDNRLMRKVRVTAKDKDNLKQIEKELQKYRPEVREIERNAKIKAYRYADELELEQRVMARVDRQARRVPRSDDPWDEGERDWGLFDFRSKGARGIKRDRVTGRGRRPKMEEVLQAEYVQPTSSAIEKARDIWDEANKVESLVLDKFSFGLGRKLKTFGQQAAKNFASDRLASAAAFGGKALNVAGAGYDRLRGAEQAFLGMVPLGLGGLAKAGLQGAGAYALLPGAAQSIVSGGAEMAISAGTSLLSGGVGGLGGATIEALGGALSMASPIIGGSVVAKAAENGLGALLPSQSTQQQRSIKQLQAANSRIIAQIEQSTINKALQASTNASAQVSQALLAPVGGEIDRTPDGIRKVKAALDGAWAEAKKALASGDVARASFLVKSIASGSKDLIAANKEVYTALPKGSDERRQLATINTDAGSLSRQAKAKLKKFEAGLKKIEQVPEEDDLRKKLDNLGDVAESFRVSVERRGQRRLREARRPNTANPLINAQIARDNAVEGIVRFAEIEQNIDKPAQKVKATLDRAVVGDVKDELMSRVKSFGSSAILAATALAGGVVAIGAASASIGLALRRISATTALETVSTDQASFNKSLASAEAFAKKLGLDTAESIKSAARIRASLEGTSVVGLSDDLGQGVSQFGRVRGANSEELGRGQIAISQIAGKPKLSAEELNQLDESIPGLGNLLASSSGYTKGQIRALAAKGKASSSDAIANLSPALTAKNRAEAYKLEENPEVKLNRLAESAKDIGAKLGGGLLVGLAPAAEVAAKAIEFLNANLSILGTAGIVAIGSFVAQVIAAQMSVAGLAGAAKLAGSALATVLVPTAAIAAIATLIEVSRSVYDLYNGTDSPSAKMIAEYEAVAAAANAASKAIADIADPRTKPKNFIEDAIKNNIDANNELLEKQAESDPARAAYIRSNKQKTFEEIQGDKVRANYDKLLALINSRPKGAIGIDGKAIADLNRQIQRLEVDGKIADPLEKPATTEARREQIAKLVSARNEKTLPLQSRKLEIEDAIKKAETIAADSLSTTNQKKSALAQLGNLNTELAGLNETARAYSQEVISLDNRLEKSTAKFSGLGLSIERLGAKEAADGVERLSGSLSTGAKAALEFELAQKQLNRQIEAAQYKSREAADILTSGDIGVTIGKLQATNRLPKDLRDTSPEQLAELKQLGVEDKIANAINLFNSAETELASKMAARGKLLSDYRQSINAEDKALRDRYEQITQEIGKNVLAARASAQALQAVNYSNSLKNSLSGFSTAIGGLVDSYIDQFIKLQGLATNEQSLIAEKYAAAMSKADAAKELSSANAASVTPLASSGSGIVNPVAGGRSALSQPDNMALQGFAASRTRKGKPGLHNGQDYVGALGADVRAVVGGKVTKIDGAFNWGGALPSQRGVDIESMIDGEKVVTRYIHIAEKAGNAFKLKLGDTIAAGTVIGVIGKDGKIGGNDYHVDIKTKVNGTYQDPAKVFARFAGGGMTPASADNFVTTKASVYYPDSGRAIDGGNKDMRGKRIDNNSMSIATRLTGTKKGLPYGSKVILRNPKTGKTVEVLVNDTGVLGRGRGVDMTPAVAKALGMKADGVQDVQIAGVGVGGALGDGELFKKFDSLGAIVKPIGSIPTRQAIAPQLAVPGQPTAQDIYKQQVAEADRKVKFAEFEKQYKDADIRSSAALETFKRQDIEVAERRRARDLQRDAARANQAKLDGIGATTPDKAFRQSKRAEIEAVTDSETAAKDKIEDLMRERQRIKLVGQNIQEGLARGTTSKEAAKPLLELLKRLPSMNKSLANEIAFYQKDYATKVAIGKKRVADLEKNKRTDQAELNYQAGKSTTEAEIAKLEATKAEVEKYLEANPFDYSKGDPLTLGKELRKRQIKLATSDKVRKLREQIDKLDPNDGTTKTQKAYLERQIKLAQETEVKQNREANSDYDLKNRDRQLAREQYRQKIPADIIARDLDLRSADANYDAAQGRSYIANTANFQISKERNAEQLKKVVADLTDQAARDPRLKPLLTVAIDKAKSIAQLEDYAAEASRNKALAVNLANLTDRRRGNEFEGQQLEIDSLGRKGQGFEARKLQEQLELAKLRQDFAVKMRELADLETANEGDTKAVAEIRLMRDELEGLNAMKLKDLKTEFSDMAGVIGAVSTEGTRLFNEMVSGKGVNTDSLNQFLSAPFKAITDQLTSFVGSWWSKLMGDLLGGIDLGGGRGQQSGAGGWIGSALSAFSGWLGIGGSGGGQPAIGLSPIIPGLNFAEGGTIGDRGLSETLLKGMARERVESGGRDPRLVIANRDEIILNPQQSMAYKKGIPNYASGSGAVSYPVSSTVSTPPIPTYRTEVINQVEYVSREELDAANARQQKALAEYDRQRQDRDMHSVSHRNAMGWRR